MFEHLSAIRFINHKLVYLFLGGKMRQLFDKTVDVKQIHVDVSHGLMLLRADRGLNLILHEVAIVFLFYLFY